MNIVESTIERLAWILVLVVLIGEIVGLIIASSILHNLKQQQMDFHNSNSSNLSIIKQNQVTEALAIKTYIACLLTLNPQASPAAIQSQEQICFDKAPVVDP